MGVTCTFDAGANEMNADAAIMYRTAGKFGGLAVCVTTAKLKSSQNFLLAYITYSDPVPDRQI